MSNVGRWDANYRNLIDNNLNQTTQQGILSGEIAGNLSNIESDLIKTYASMENATSDADLKALQAKAQGYEAKYRRASRVFEALQTIMKNADEIMRRAIANLSIR